MAVFCARYRADENYVNSWILFWYMLTHLNQKGLVIWLLGLSGSGKSTIVTLLEAKLNTDGFFVMSMDGDAIRAGLNSDLTYTEADRLENIRRVAELSNLLVRRDIITICSFITPKANHRQTCRSILGEKYFEVYLNCPLHVCESRDTKGLYRKARNHEIENFTGLTSDFEPPLKPDMVLHTSAEPAEHSAEKLYDRILQLVSCS